ncbi:MAG TPA: Wzz/FepE/Etk N-terminal domain-containing protein [Candidatus Acidoferrum sp.]|nr:Wzz/FepE/Etk N-terminal domain-containing protein [Candidatus Acidoferrum sp.]
MFEEKLNSHAKEVKQGFATREFLAIGFRQRQLIINTFLGIFSIAVVIAFLLPKKFEAQMKILVRHERAESVVSPEREAPVQWRTEVSEEELQSEAELIKSRDLLTKVVVACDLHNPGTTSFWSSGGDNSDQRVSRAVLRLEKDLTVQPIKLTNLISVSYKARDPQLAAKVLNSLASLYLEKHLAMHRAPGQFEFFHQQAEEYRRALAGEKEKLTNFSQTQGVVNPALEKEMSVRKLAEFEAETKVARASMAENRQRIATLEAQLATLPNRQTTQVRTSDNPELMQNLKSKLLELELKRTELLTKFEPTYRPVQEIEEQIAQAKAAITGAEKAPLRDETTDRDPTYEALRSELAKAKTELAATQARAAATSSLIRTYRSESEQLDRKEILQEDILRAAKADEENYMLYLRKAEEARISDALDRQRFSNVVVAEPATVPFTAQGRWLLVVVLGGFLASLMSVILAFIADRWDPSFRTPEEVESFLGSPVVAAFPKNGE